MQKLGVLPSSDAELAYAARAMAVAVRGGRDVIAGVILHTDQGVHRRAGAGRLRPVGHPPVDGPARVVPVNRPIQLISNRKM
jgi:hypothetical protein